MAAGIGASLSVTGWKELQQAFTRLKARAPEAVKREIRASAELVRARMLRLVSQPGRGRTYTRRTVTHVASAPFDPPATDRGWLKARISAADAISYHHGGFTAEVGPRNYPVAVYLEYGTARMAPRPFAFRALELERGQIVARLRRALTRELPP